MSKCYQFVFWKICPIILIVFISMLIKYIGKILDLALQKASKYTTLSWFVAFAASLGIGAAIQKYLGIRNMWKSPLAKKEASGSGTSLSSLV
ncbi:MAG: hypothetical protein H6850_01745 [Alphaproteobacteria bacterium]|nr:MAG: hypothetical protein H6850_01745 [Alphaproteobacteria bacterium]